MNDEQEKDVPIFGVTCANFHTSYFDKREVCPDSGVVVARRLVQEEGRVLNELRLVCKTPGCGKKVKVKVDCEDYK